MGRNLGCKANSMSLGRLQHSKPPNKYTQHPSPTQLSAGMVRGPREPLDHICLTTVSFDQPGPGANPALVNLIGGWVSYVFSMFEAGRKTLCIPTTKVSAVYSVLCLQSRPQAQRQCRQHVCEANGPSNSSSRGSPTDALLWCWVAKVIET